MFKFETHDLISRFIRLTLDLGILDCITIMLLIIGLNKLAS